MDGIGLGAVDTLLARREREGRPIRVGLVGVGAVGRAIARQLAGPVPGLRLSALAGRTLEGVSRAATGAGLGAFTRIRTQGECDAVVARGGVAVTEAAELVCGCTALDVIVEASADVEFGARVACDAIARAKAVVLVNAELDATVGSALKARADVAGAVITGTDGDEPGVAMNLVRLVRSLGLRAVGAGNLKGFLDRRRTPETQAPFAAANAVSPWLATAAADGTKLAVEATILANATGFGVGRRGMYGPRCAHVRDAAGAFPMEQLLGGGLVDYVLGAEPHVGAFVLVYEPDPAKQQWLRYLKLGDGPMYVLHTPYHLPHLQVVNTIARAALLEDATITPLGAPVCEVVTIAKRDLSAGELLDGIGGFLAYGTIENARQASQDALLPIGVSKGCRLTRDVSADEPVTRADVELPPGRLVDRLRAEQGAAASELAGADAGATR
ncbi:MAG TPA: SAF domain-containing protein [Solirubrobacteraceae bacterium]|nr:SAF domain-containing protein [Solirubrobacteraceae bacterium]